VVFSVLDNPVAFMKVKCQFNFRDNLKKVLVKFINNRSLRHRNGNSCQ